MNHPKANSPLGAHVVLRSTDRCVLRSLEFVASSINDLRLAICGNVAELAQSLLDGEVALLILHVANGDERTQARELLRSFAETNRPIPTVLLTEGCDEVEKRDLLRAGAAFCLPRSVNLKALTRLVDALTLRARLPLENGETVSEQDAEEDSSFYIIAPEMEQMMEQVRRVVPQDTTILFTGETGTGKTRLARLIHERSPRKEEPFLIVDCNSLSPSVIESELFGHVKGAFTGADRDRPGKFAAAGKGTLVLDEINSLPLPLQSKLLRVVDERVFEPVGSNKSQPLKARLITISNAPLQQEVAAGRFRADLYYRLNVVGFYLPPLRDRPSVIGDIARAFLRQFAQNNRPDMLGITDEAIRVMQGYSWPGNIRELSNVIERAVALFPGPMIEAGDLPESIREANRGFPACELAARERTENATGPMSLVQTKEQAEINRINEALRKHRNNRLRAAAELGISRVGLYKKLHKYGLHHFA